MPASKSPSILTRRHFLVVLASAASVLPLAAACQPAAPPAAAPTLPPAQPTTAAPAATSGASGGVARVKERGLYPAIFASAPLSYLDGSTWTGSEADTTNFIATNTLSLKPEQVYPVILPIGGLLPGLQSKRYDTVAGLSINPQRLEVAIATQIIHFWGSRPMMRKGDDLLNKIHSWTDMAKNGVELGLVQGANEIAEAQKRGIQVRTYPTIDLQVKDLLANRINVILIGDLGAPGIIDQTNGQVAMADPFDYEGIQSSAAFYFHPDDRDLRDLFNTAITDMKNSGKVKEILTKYNIPLNIPPPGPANG